MSKKSILEIEPLDILVSTWGYDCTNVYYYAVVKRNDKSVWLYCISNNFEPYNPKDRQAGGLETPKHCDGTKYTGEIVAQDVFVKRLPKDGQESIKLTSYSRAYVWDGKPRGSTVY